MEKEKRGNWGMTTLQAILNGKPDFTGKIAGTVVFGNPTLVKPLERKGR